MPKVDDVTTSTSDLSSLDELDITEAAAKVRLHRARARLRDGLVALRPSQSRTPEVDAEVADVIDLNTHRNAS